MTTSNDEYTIEFNTLVKKHVIKQGSKVICAFPEDLGNLAEATLKAMKKGLLSV